MAETKHEKFLRLAEARVGKTLEDLRLVSQLASNNYENEPEEAQEIVDVLHEKVNEVADAFGVRSTQVAVKTEDYEPDTSKLNLAEEPVEEVHQPEEPEVVFPPPIRFTSEEMHYAGKIDADDVRSALQLITYSRDLEGAVAVLRAALKDSPQ